MLSSMIFSPSAFGQQVCISIGRIQIVQDAAAVVCRQAFNLPRGSNAGQYVADEADRRNFTQEERIFLLNLCQAFGDALVNGDRGR